MIFKPLSLQDSYLVEPDVLNDERGSFSRYYCDGEFKQIGHTKPWVQLNHSYTQKKGTLRGLHFQTSPYSEIKMVKCVVGEIFDVIVDLRKGSKTFLKWTGVELSAGNRRTIYIPEGFAHGFQTLTDNCELIYHHSAAYEKTAEGGVRWNDPLLEIQWPLIPAHISDRDMQFFLLAPNFQGI